MVSGISNRYDLYGYQNAVNQVRLNQALQNRTQSADYVDPIRAVDRVNKNLTDSLSYLKRYTSTMSDLMSSANALRKENSSGVMNKTAALSSDESVVETGTSSRFLEKGAAYEISVSQLAAAQLNQSEAVQSNAAASGDINLGIESGAGQFNISVSATDAKGNQKTNSQLLTEAAKAINDTGAGVSASVVTENGKSSLQIVSAETGSKSAFSVTGDYASKSGLAAADVAAQDAKYSVKQNGKTTDYTSSTNNVSLAYGRMDISLKKTGDATITTGPDPEKTVSAMEKLVESYNKAVSLLGENSDRGNGTRQMLSKVTRAIPGSGESMELLGLSANKDGTLSLDKDKLTSSLKKNGSLVNSLISDTSGIAQKAFEAGKTAMATSGSSVLSDDLAQQQIEQMSDPLVFQNNLYRSGAYNMMNYYAAGMLFNVMA